MNTTALSSLLLSVVGAFSEVHETLVIRFWNPFIVETRC